MRRSRSTVIVMLAAAVTLAAAACSSTKKPAGGGQPSGAPSSSGAAQTKFFNQADFDRQMAQRTMTPQGDSATPWLQMIQPTMVDTSKYAKPGGKWHVCFSNAGTGNPWRVTGLTTIKAEAKLHPEIGELTIVDAASKDDKQISDLADLQTKKCDALIVSPNTTTALTPAVERACQSGVPVVVFDRGVSTDCPVSFVHPIGGYAFGAASAEFIAQKEKLTAIAPTYPVYQWRTALIAATYILSGKQVPKEWVLPQPVITADNLSQYLIPGMPPLFFSSCGCKNMPGFPQDWGGK